MQRGRASRGASARTSLIRAPAIQALLIQLLAFALVLAVATGLPALVGNRLSIGMAVILQGAIAASVTAWRAMAWWWLPIQLLFPLALMVLHALHLPPWIFLAAFVALLALYWTTFRTQVPFYPSNAATWNAVAALLPAARSLRFIDIGSGFGGLVMHLAARRPECRFVGIELAPLPWLASVVRARIRRSAGRFVRGDYGRLHFAGQDVVFAYLSPAAMPALWQKARSEMHEGALLLSFEFPIPGVEPHIVTYPVESGPALYGWKM